MTKKINRIAFIIDRSGSMQGIMPKAIEAFNQNIEEIKKQIKETGQLATITLITFDDKVETVYFNRPIDACEPLGPRAIMPRGQTALFDAVGNTILELKNLPIGSDEDVSYLLNTITDGFENYSKKFNNDSLTDLMMTVQSTDRWTLTFLTPRGGTKILENFGIPTGNILEWSSTAEGVKAYTHANNVGISNFIRSRVQGITSTNSFYTNAASLSTQQVKSTLTDISSYLTVYTVDRDCEISKFFESRGIQYKKGCAFYELVAGKKSADKVQNYKKILLMENGKKQIYAGQDVRYLLGIPMHETKVRPGNNGKYVIFIQSTSLNRKLKKGTRVIYWPTAAL